MQQGRHICTECNLIYEEPSESLDPNRKSFDSLPDSWKCGCGALKERFQPCSCASLEAQNYQHEQQCNVSQYV